MSRRASRYHSSVLSERPQLGSSAVAAPPKLPPKLSSKTSSTAPPSLASQGSRGDMTGFVIRHDASEDVGDDATGSGDVELAGPGDHITGNGGGDPLFEVHNQIGAVLQEASRVPSWRGSSLWGRVRRARLLEVIFSFLAPSRPLDLHNEVGLVAERVHVLRA